MSIKFGRKPKAPNNTGRTTPVTGIMISRELKERLSELKDAYELCYSETVTYDQMLRRWADMVKRIDPKVVPLLEEVRTIRKGEKEKFAAGLGITAEQLEENEAAFDPTDPAYMPWKLNYFFEKDGEQLEAVPGNYTSFYAKVNNKNVGIKAMLAEGWTFQNENGNELDILQAEKIRALIKEHRDDQLVF